MTTPRTKTDVISRPAFRGVLIAVGALADDYLSLVEEERKQKADGRRVVINPNLSVSDLKFAITFQLRAIVYGAGLRSVTGSPSAPGTLVNAVVMAIDQHVNNPAVLEKCRLAIMGDLRQFPIADVNHIYEASWPAFCDAIEAAQA